MQLKRRKIVRRAIAAMMMTRMKMVQESISQVILRKDKGYVWKRFTLPTESYVSFQKHTNGYTDYPLDVLPMKDTKKKELLEEVVEKYFGENDIAKARYFRLDSLDQYRELQRELSKVKKPNKRKT